VVEKVLKCGADGRLMTDARMLKLARWRVMVHDRLVHGRAFLRWHGTFLRL